MFPQNSGEHGRQIPADGAIDLAPVGVDHDFQIVEHLLQPHYGELLLDGQYPLNDQSYRAFTFKWTGRPADKPAVAVRPNPARGSAVHVSWNGATDVETWKVLAGRSASALAAAGSQRRGGFETIISVNSEGPYFAVTAHDSSGRQLGQSATVKRTAA